MEANLIREMIVSSIIGSKVEVIDTNQTGDHFSVLIISDAFVDMPLIERHKLIYKLLNKHITKEIHALQLKTVTNAEYEKI